MKHLFALFLGLSSLTLSAQSNYISTGKTNGDWNNPKSWQLAPGSVADDDSDGIPDANDNVTIRSGHTIVVKATNACKNLTLADQGDFTELIVDASGSLNITEVFLIQSMLKESEVNIDIRGAVNADQTDVQSYGQDVNVILKVRASGSLMVAAKEVKSLTQLTSR